MGKEREGRRKGRAVDSTRPNSRRASNTLTVAGVEDGGDQDSYLGGSCVHAARTLPGR